MTHTPPPRTRGSSQLGMRQYNERVLLQALRLQQPLSKAALARITGLTPQTVGLITQRLEQDGLLLRHAPVRGRVGQPSVPLALDPQGAYAIGVRIGRRVTDCLLVDFNGAVCKRLSLAYRVPEAQQLLPAVRGQLQALRRSLGPRASRLVGVGLAMPFHIGGWQRLLGLPARQAEEWQRTDLVRALQRMTRAPVSHARDTAAACVAELVLGRGRELRNFLYLFVDTFVGGALVLDSRLHAGLHGNAGAVASLPVALAGAGGPPPQMVSHASLWELEQRFRAHGLEAAAASDERALQTPWRQHTQRWLKTAANALAHCIVSGTAFVDVEAVVLDGALARDTLQALIEETRRALDRYRWEGLWRPALHAGSIGAEAGALGGALLPLHAHFAPDSELFLKAAA